MSYERVCAPAVVYHLTRRENAEKILKEKCVRRFSDTECWFCRSIADMIQYMNMTVMNEGKPYYSVGGVLCFYPKFVPDHYVILEIPVGEPDANWYIWNQEVPCNATLEYKKKAELFSKIKIGYRGDLHFDEVCVYTIAE